MILGQFKWRHLTIEVDRAVGSLAGQAAWLTSVDDDGNRTPIATVLRDGEMKLSVWAPTDTSAPAELNAAYSKFRSSLPAPPMRWEGP